MKIEGWQYYNHAALPTTRPYELTDLSPINDGDIWKIGGGCPLLACWNSDYDCAHETNWWYVIKDTPFDISALKSKRRYEINKGNKNYEVTEIDPKDYKEELYSVQVAAFSHVPQSIDQQSIRVHSFLIMTSGDNMSLWAHLSVKRES